MLVTNCITATYSGMTTKTMVIKRLNSSGLLPSWTEYREASVARLEELYDDPMSESKKLKQTCTVTEMKVDWFRNGFEHKIILKEGTYSINLRPYE